MPYDDLIKGLQDLAAEIRRAEDAMLLVEAANVIEELDGLLYEAERDRDEYRERLDKTNDAIEELSKLADAIPHVCECCIGCEVESGGCDNAFVLSPKRAREYLNKPRWVSVTERLPEQGKQYLVIRFDEVTKTQFIDILWHDAHDLWWNRLYKGNYNVTHWMPIPQLPKEADT